MSWFSLVQLVGLVHGLQCFNKDNSYGKKTNAACVAPPLLSAVFIVHRMKVRSYEFMDELLVLKSSRSTDICYDIRLNNAHNLP